MEDHEKIFNWRQVSQVLTGGAEGVRSNYKGKKHRAAVNELKEFAAAWTAKHGKDLKTVDEIVKRANPVLLDEYEPKKK